mmetsp:Transcript_16671/g.36856  ORF Transcript_16671/g.36856 Transcript_16671/m.36856 type:complete len:270 (-) Transcript_16671:283-1092(-)
MSFLLDYPFELGHSIFLMARGWRRASVPMEGSFLYLKDPSQREGVAVDELPPVPPGSLRLAFISDTHEQHDKVKIPEVDILMHCGDMLLANRHFTTGYSEGKLESFLKWFGDQPAKHKVFIAGNHDLVIEALGVEAVRERLPNGVTYLEGDAVELEGLKIWGCPASTGKSGNKAFQQGDDPCGELGKIPEGSDVVLTHVPGTWCGQLSGALEKCAPQVHACGHVHRKYGVHRIGQVLSVNAAVVDDAYAVSKLAIVVDVPRPQGQCASD